MNLQELLFPLDIAGMATAVLCGLIIGTERQLAGKPAGIRTSILICLGTYVFVTSNYILQQGNTTDPSRIIGQIITGIGFLGAGVILTREGIVIGVTSAAVIWILAGIGILIGLEKHIASIILSAVTVTVLSIVNVLENVVVLFQKGVYSKIAKRHKD
ncbi:MAG: MgtC/SapB family protein [Elusimicrobiota bacterium]